MNIRTKAFAKGGIAAMAAGAMAFTATPALADDHYDDDDGISAGEVIAGAVILGGIAAIAGAIGDDDRDGYVYNNGYYNNGRYYNGNRWGYRGSPRGAIKRCIAVANDQARRNGYRHARVTEIRDVDDSRHGWRVEGRVVVDGRYGGGRYNRYGYYDRDNRYNRWNDRDRGSFQCRVEGQRVTYLDFDGIRGLG